MERGLGWLGPDLYFMHRGVPTRVVTQALRHIAPRNVISLLPLTPASCRLMLRLLGRVKRVAALRFLGRVKRVAALGTDLSITA